ncbi:MAG: hypothetical protein IPM42_16310 [Saprospiraceae bacterium]|nr:hypothetical protein [Saprospiraceae bacterium]
MEKASSKKVVIIPIFAIIGYLSNFLYYHIEYNLTGIGFILELFSLVKPPSDLGYYMNEFSISPNFFFHRIYFFETILGVVTILGLLQYIISNGKRFNLLGFSFSIIFFSTLVNLILQIYGLIFTGSEFAKLIPTYINKTLFLALNLIWIVLSFYILKTLTAQINLKKFENSDVKLDYQRISIYSVLDLLLAMLILTPLIMILIGSFLHALEIIGLVKISIIIMGVMSIFIYNLFFDIQFGLTPGRFLFGKLLLTPDIHYLSAKNSLLRTYYNITLNKESATPKWQLFRINEDTTSPFRRILFLLFFIMVLGGYGFHSMSKKYTSQTHNNAGHTNKFHFISSNLQYLDTTTIIELGKNNSSRGLYLKILNIEDDSILMSVIDNEGKYIKDVNLINEMFLNSQDSVTIIKISKADLNEKYIGFNYSNLYPCHENFIIEQQNGKDSFCLRFLYNYAKPSLLLDYFLVVRNRNIEKAVELKIKNWGSTGFITDFKSNDENCRLIVELPLKLNSIATKIGSENIRFKIADYWSSIDIELTVVNDLTTPTLKQKYRVTGKPYNLLMKRIE